MRLSFTSFFFIGYLFLTQFVHESEKISYSSSTSVLVNKNPGDSINSKQGPRQIIAKPLATTVEIYQSGCIVPKLDFDLGENICGEIASDIFSQLKFQWQDPAGFIRRESGALVSNPQTDSWTLPSTKTTQISPGLFIDNRGTWTLIAGQIPTGNQGSKQFWIHDPANLLAELQLNAFASPDPVNAGSNITYTFSAVQNGPDAATNVVFTASIPQNTTFVSLSAPAGWTVNAPSGGTVTATRAIWNAFPLNIITPPDAFQLVVTAPAAVPNNTQFTSVGTIISTTEDRRLYDNAVSAKVSTTAGTAGPAIISQTAGLLTENCSPANGTIDPGETVTVTFEVRNVGNQAANNVMGTLLSLNNVTSPPPPVSFGNIAAGATVSRDITFIANPAALCGSALIPSMSLTSDPGSTNRGTIVFPRLNMLSNPSGPSNIPVCCSASPSCAMTCPANITIANDVDQCGAIVNYPPPTTSGSCGTVTVLPLSGSFFPVGTTTVTATSSAGPTCTFSITVNDVQPPVITCPPSITQTAGAGCSANVATPAPTHSDNCGVIVRTWTLTGATIGSSPASGINSVGTQTFNVGTTTVTYTVKDAANNQATCSFNVTISDSQNPTISCPGNITQANDPNLCTANIATPAPAHSDNCGVVTRTWTLTGATTGSSPATGINSVGSQLFNVGITTVTYTVKDAADNQATCSFTVTVNDTQNPAIACPGNITQANSPGLCLATVTTPNPTTTDNCSVTALTWVLSGATTATSPATGINNIGTRSFNVGVTNVTYTARDASGNIANCSFTVTVNDTQNPTVTCPANQTGTNTPGLCTGVVATPAPTHTDNCAVTLRTWALTGATSGASAATGINTVPAGQVFNVGVTTVTYTVRDAAGNSATCSFTVTVTDTENPVITCPVNITVTTPIGSCTALVTYAVTATDNCPGVTMALQAGLASGSAFPLGVNPVNWRATDAAGNTANCTFTVTVIDGQLPVISAQPQTRFVCEGSSATLSVISTNAVSYQWQQFSGGTWNNIPGATGPTYTLSNVTIAMNTNTFRVNVIGLCTTVTSSAATLFVNPNPLITLSSSIPPLLLPGQSLTITATAVPSGGSFVWLKNGVVIAGSTTNALSGLTVDDQGSFAVRYTDPNGCVTTSAPLVVAGQSSDNLWVYPNPNAGDFSVRFFNSPGETATVTVFNSLGQKVLSKQTTTGLTYSLMTIKLVSRVAAGTYHVVVTNNAGKIIGSKKIVVRPD